MLAVGIISHTCIASSYLGCCSGAKKGDVLAFVIKILSHEEPDCYNQIALLVLRMHHTRLSHERGGAATVSLNSASYVMERLFHLCFLCPGGASASADSQYLLKFDVKL